MNTLKQDIYKTPINFTLPLKQKAPFHQLKINIESVKKGNFKPLKVGIRKLPGDFFGKKLERKAKQAQCLTDRAHFRNKFHNEDQILERGFPNEENDEQILPEAQVTSFFKMAEIKYNHPNQKDKYRSQLKLEERKSQKKQSIQSSNYTTLVKINNNPSLIDLGATFSRKLNSQDEDERTPDKTSGLNKNQFQKNDQVRSMQMKRPSKQITLTIQHQSKTSQMKERMKKYSHLQAPRQFSLGDTIMKEKKPSQGVNLPKIHRIQ